MRKLAKKSLFFVAAVVVSLPAALCFLEKRQRTGDFLFLTFGQLLAIVPGRIGVQLRAAFHAMALDDCDWEVHIGFGTLFMHRNAIVGKHASTGAYCVLGHVTLGSGVRLASRVSIPSGKRQHLDEQGRMTDSNHFDRVCVGAGSWIGEGAIVLADVGAGSIVSAGAVVINALPDRCLAGGNPARVLRSQDAAPTGDVV